MTGHGGWPMTCFLTPDGRPFFCGTYFPRAQLLQVLLRSGVSMGVPLTINTVSTDNVMASSEVLVVSGTAAGNTTVTLGINGQTVNTTSDATGNWSYDGAKVRYIAL